ncbi:MAG: class I SAM-dependent methyltransferase [Candidatus Bathyarchaeia archaeon]
MATSRIIDYSVTFNREARAEEAVTALKLSGHDLKKGALLDIGCGTGSTTRWFAANLGVYSVGVEVLNLFKSPANALNPRLGFAFASGLALPFRAKSFHTVVLNDVLEHVSYRDADRLFSQISSVLDEDGMLYVSVANKYQVMEPHSGLLFISWLPRWIYLPMVRRFFHDEVYPYTVDKFRALSDRAGFSCENYTWLYVAKKMRDVNYIGNTMVRPMAKALIRLGLAKSPGFLRFLERFAVLLFVCRKHK